MGRDCCRRDGLCLRDEIRAGRRERGRESRGFSLWAGGPATLVLLLSGVFALRDWDEAKHDLHILCDFERRTTELVVGERGDPELCGCATVSVSLRVGAGRRCERGSYRSLRRFWFGMYFR